MKLTRRDWMTVGGLAGLAAVTAPAMAQEAVPAAAAGKVSEAQLGEMLAALGLQADKKRNATTFPFVAPLDDQQWELSMSAVLSQDQSSLWVMAWLDELPKSSADVPRTALLRLLAENDQLGGGKFFAYIPANRRFVLQQVVANENMTSAKLRYILQDLGSSVIDTYGIWSVQSWNSTGSPPVPEGGSAAVAPPTPEGGAARTVTNDPNFEQPVRR